MRSTGADHAADIAALGAKFTKKQEKAAARVGVNLAAILAGALPTINK